MIAFSCSHCGMKFSVKEEFAGRATKCATCKQPMTVPQPINPTMVPGGVGQLRGMPSSLNRAGVPATMTLAPPENDVPQPGQKTVSQLLASNANAGERYVLEGEVARGGMGMVLRAVDCDIRREVAVKKMLDQSDPRKKLRFIEEAQITGQLEHPNIVPIHELGVDGQDQLFFSMKMVKGRSLAEIIAELLQSPRFAERQYPLSKLLTVFVSVCNALAYAHSRGVVHRDLKPANIMVGDFGEVYVMDWGLAKVLKGVGSFAPETASPLALPAPPTALALASAGATQQIGMHVAIPVSPSATALDTGSGTNLAGPPVAIALAADGTAFSKGSGKVITSREMEADLTQEGSILGTPVYMPPEQASGRIHAIDQRSDIYSLGAILYELLALQAPISRDGTYTDVILRVIKGEIVPPEWENRSRYRAGKIPLELSAVAMKALATHPENRYQKVEDLRSDVELFMAGRSVSAKEDTRRELAVKFIKRNKAFSAAVAAALVLLAIVVTASFRVNLKARRDAEKAEADAVKNYEIYEEEQKEKEKRTRQAVPALVEVARRDADRRLFDKAMTQVNVALDYDPENAEARLLHAQLLIAKEEFKEGLADLEKYLKKNPKDRDAVDLNKLCSKSRPEDVGNLVQIASVFTRQQAPSLAEGLLRRHGASADAVRQKLLELYRKRIETTWEGRSAGLTLDKEGRFQFAMGSDDIRDLSPLKDIPLNWLQLQGREIRDLSPLQGMPLTVLHLTCPTLTNLSGLKGLPISSLSLHNCESLSDLSGLKGAPIETLNFDRCGSITTLVALTGAPLTSVSLTFCGGLVNLHALKGMPIRSLHFNSCGIRELSPLAGLPLKDLQILNCSEVRDLNPLKDLKITSLTIIGCNIRDVAALKDVPLTSITLGGCSILKDLSGLKDLRLTSIDLSGSTEVRDLSPLQGMPLQSVNLTNCGLLTDLSGLKGLKLTNINLSGCGRIQDLSPLAGMPLSGIELRGTGIKDLSVLKGLALTSLNIEGCPALADISGLKGMPLTFVNLNNCPEVRDLSPLQGMPLSRIDLAACGMITDLGPLKECPLTQIDLRGCSGIRDLTALKGMKFNMLDLQGCTSLMDISAIKGMPLNRLTFIDNVKIEDLSPLKGLTLLHLHLQNCEKLRDLSPLQGMPLTSLIITNCPNITDLSGLKGLQLTSLNIGNCGGIMDLTSLKDMPLTGLHLTGCAKIVDLSPLKELKLNQLSLSSTSVRDLAPLQQMPLAQLQLDKCVDLHDLTPLEGMKLNEVRLPPQVKKGIEVLRNMKTLGRIDDRPPEQFWPQYDASKPRPK